MSSILIKSDTTNGGETQSKGCSLAVAWEMLHKGSDRMRVFPHELIFDWTWKEFEFNMQNVVYTCWCEIYDNSQRFSSGKTAGSKATEGAKRRQKWKNISLPSSRQTRVANKKHTNKLHQHLSAKDVARENVFRVDSIQVRLINDRHFSKPDSESCSVINIWFRKAVRATFTSVGIRCNRIILVVEYATARGYEFK